MSNYYKLKFFENSPDCLTTETVMGHLPQLFNVEATSHDGEIEAIVKDTYVPKVVEYMSVGAGYTCTETQPIDKEDESKTPALYKTNVTIWSEFEPGGVEIHDLGWEAMFGNAYCSKQKIELVHDPESDPDWEQTEFFLEL